MTFANVFSLSTMILLSILPGCSSEQDTLVAPKIDTVLNNKEQINALKNANQNLYTNPKLAKNIARDSENWVLNGEALALRQWLHTQQQANRGDYDQAWRMINDIDTHYLPSKAQKEAMNLHWQLATMLNVCPQWQGTHEQQFNFLAMTEGLQCSNNSDKALLSLVTIMKDPSKTDWAKKLQAWHEANPQHWANELIKWHKLSNINHGPKQVAIILPLSGDFAKAGKEIQEGILTLHPFLSQTTLSFHDTAELGPQKAYDQALKTNPSMIIGPLTNKEVQSITINDTMPMITFAPPKYPHQNVVHMSHDPYQVPKLLSLSKALGHAHMVWLTDPVFNNMQSYWPNSVARFGQIPIKADALKSLLMVEDNTKTTNTNLQYDGLMVLGSDTSELQTVAHEYIVDAKQTFITGPDAANQKHFFEHTVMLKSAWLNQENDNSLTFSPFSKMLSKVNAYNQTWYNAIGIDALLMAYYSNELNAMKVPMTMATGVRQINKNELILKLQAHHVQDNKWHPLLTLNTL